MAEVPSLKRMSCWVTVQAVLNIREDTTSASSSKLISLFQTDAYTAVSGLVLLEVLEYYALEITDNILLCLVPPHVKQLNLRHCSQLSAVGLQHVLNRCKHIEKLDLSGCDQVLRPTLFQLVGHISPQLTSVTLEECSLACDVLVKNILKSLVHLSHLNLSGCCNVTDDAFILNRASQLRFSRYSAEVVETERVKPKCKLRSINVSACKQITSKGIRNITSLCGPTLQNVDISYTKADCISLLYLAGLSLYSAFKIALATEHSSHSTTASIGNILLPSLPNVASTSNAQDLTVDDIESVNDLETEADASVNGNSTSVIQYDGNDSILNRTKQSASSSECAIPHGSSDSGHSTKYDFVQTCSKGAEPINVDHNVQSMGNLEPEEGASCTSANSYPFCTVKSDTFRCVSHDISWSDISSESESEESNDVQKACCADEKPISSASASTENDPHTTNAKQDLINGVRKSDLYKCIQGKLGFAQKLYDPQLISLEIDGIDFQNVELGEACLKEFFDINRTLERFSMSWGELNDPMMGHIAKCAPQLKSISLVDCDSLSASGVATLCMMCHQLVSVNFQGICFFGDVSVFPLVSRGRARNLNLAESNVTDNTLQKIASSCSETLEELDLSWCEEIGTENGKGLTNLVTSCSILRKLALRQCQMVEATISKISENCLLLGDLNLSSVNCVADSLLVSLSMRLKELTKIDISWNSAVTDVGVGALLSHCRNLQEANFAGIKQLTTDTFLPIISDVRQWKRSQALLRLKYHERKELDGDQFSSDEEFEELCLPHRSTVYATRLKCLDVEYCDQVNDTQLAELVAVCRGTLKIRDYYGEQVKPNWVTCRKGRVFLAPQY